MTDTVGPADPSDRWFALVDGARLRQLRRQHDLSPAELAGKAGLSMSTIIRLERPPSRRCRTRTLALLAGALGQPPATLTPQPHLAQSDQVIPP